MCQTQADCLKCFALRSGTVDGSPSVHRTTLLLSRHSSSNTKFCGCVSLVPLSPSWSRAVETFARCSAHHSECCDACALQVRSSHSERFSVGRMRLNDAQVRKTCLLSPSSSSKHKKRGIQTRAVVSKGKNGQGPLEGRHKLKVTHFCDVCFLHVYRVTIPYFWCCFSKPKHI